MAGVLVVDDQVDLCRVTARLLRLEGHDGAYTTTGPVRGRMA